MHFLYTHTQIFTHLRADGTPTKTNILNTNTYRDGLGVLGLRGVNGFAAGFNVNTFLVAVPGFGSPLAFPFADVPSGVPTPFALPFGAPPDGTVLPAAAF